MQFIISNSKSHSSTLKSGQQSSFLAMILILMFGMALSSTVLGQEGRRPVYVVAHRCNSNNMDVVKDHGVNAIEADFRYGKQRGKKGWYLAHDNVLASSVPLNTWLETVRKETKRSGSPLALLHIDIKTPNAPLDDLFDDIRSKLPSIYLLFDIGLVENGKFLEKIKTRILNDPRSAASMGFDDSPQKVNKYFKDNHYPIHKYWYEVGLAAGFKWSEEEKNWARQAIKDRNEGKGPKVVIWTFEKESTVKEWLDEGVDGILVNSSKAFGRTNAFATDAPVHVRNAKALTTAKYGTPSDDAMQIVRDKRRNYNLLIKTGSKWNAGTDSNIFVNIHGTEGSTGEQRLNGLISGNAFERGDSDGVRLNKLQDVGRISRIDVRSDGKYGNAGWYLEYIMVGGKIVRFDTWLEGSRLRASRNF